MCLNWFDYTSYICVNKMVRKLRKILLQIFVKYQNLQFFFFQNHSKMLLKIFQKFLQISNIFSKISFKYLYIFSQFFIKLPNAILMSLRFPIFESFANIYVSKVSPTTKQNFHKVETFCKSYYTIIQKFFTNFF